MIGAGSGAPQGAPDGSSDSLDDDGWGHSPPGAHGDQRPLSVTASLALVASASTIRSQSECRGQDIPDRRLMGAAQVLVFACNGIVQS